jgi:hypothetical protein
MEEVSEEPYTEDEVVAYTEYFAEASSTPFETPGVPTHTIESLKLIRFIRQCKVNGQAVQLIWELVRTKERAVSFYQFMAAMRLISCYHTQQELCTANMLRRKDYTAQPVFCLKDINEYSAYPAAQLVTSTMPEYQEEDSEEDLTPPPLQADGGLVADDRNVRPAVQGCPVEMVGVVEEQETAEGEVGEMQDILLDSIYLPQLSPTLHAPSKIGQGTSLQAEAKDKACVGQGGFKEAGQVFRFSLDPLGRDLNQPQESRQGPKDQAASETKRRSKPHADLPQPPTDSPRSLDGPLLTPRFGHYEYASLDTITHKPDKPLNFSILGEPSAKLYPRLSIIPEASKPMTEVKVPRWSLVSQGVLGQWSYVSYVIEVWELEQTWTVERRYSDFEWLNTQLGLTYRGSMIPSLPEKRVFRNTQSSFVEERRAYLEIYLAHVSSHPALSKSEAFQSFIKGSRQEFKASQKQIGKAKPSWLKVSSLEDIMDSIIALIQSRYMRSNWKVASREVSQIELKLDTLASPTKQLESVFKSHFNAVGQHANAVAAFEVLGDELNGRLKAHSAKVCEDLRTFSHRLGGELARVEALRNAISSYKATLQEHARTEALLNRQQNKLRAATSETFAHYQRRFTDAEAEVASLDMNLRTIEEKLEEEDSRCRDLRAESLSLILAQLSETMLRRSLEARLLWSESSF